MTISDCQYIRNVCKNFSCTILQYRTCKSRFMLQYISSIPVKQEFNNINDGIGIGRGCTVKKQKQKTTKEKCKHEVIIQ